MMDQATLDQATLAAGCFWGVEAAFRRVAGVRDVTVGYTGGTTPDPDYHAVCSGRTGHAEAVLVRYDRERVSYQQLLDFFWKIHDPTTLNRQGPDVGTQYRSAIFTHTPEQAALAMDSLARLAASGQLRRPVVTEILPATEFFPAEEYHQRYLEKHGRGGCALPGEG